MKIITIITLPFFIIAATISANAQTVILNADFSKGLPTGWSTTQNTYAVGWQFGDSAQAVEIYQGSTYFGPPSLGNIAFDLDLNNNDIDGFATEDRLITPALDLTAYTDSSIYLVFDAYFLQENLHGSVEGLTCEVSTNNGSTWTTLKTLYGMGVWYNVSVDISAYAGQSNVEFCFHYDDGGTEEVGAAVGNIQIFVPAFVPEHKVVFEEGTGTWCSYCVKGIVYQDSLEKEYPNDAITIAVHDELYLHFGFRLDPLTIPLYDSCETDFPGFSGYPSDIINRLAYDYTNNVFAQYAAHVGDFGEAVITVDPTYNASTRNATINVSADFARNLNGKYNFALVLTEDSVHNDSASYDQYNAYSGGGDGIMGNFQNLPDPIPSTQMYYMYVARAILGTDTNNSYTGTPGSLPTTLAAKTTYSYQYTYTIPTAYNASKMKAIALLINATTGNILNSNSSPFTVTSGINELSAGVTGVGVFPNPADNNFNVALNLTKSEHVVITLTDILGRTLATTDEGNLSSGQYNFQFDASGFSTGLYLMTIKTNDGTITKKIEKAQ